jgi:DNA primase
LLRRQCNTIFTSIETKVGHMAAYGHINDGENLIAVVDKGQVRANTPEAELVGTEKDGNLFDLDGKLVGHLSTGGTGDIMKAWWPKAQ